MALILISRGTYSGGTTLAQQVAARLGLPCVSREVLIEEAALRAHVPAGALTAAMEQRPPFWQRVLGERTAYLTFVRAALAEHAQSGQLVYHGYVGHLLLPGIPQVLRVRVIADLETRVQAALFAHATRETALAHLALIDQERRDWSGFLFGVDWEEPLLYDLVLNVSHMSVGTATEAVVQAAHGPEFQPTPASTKALADFVVQSRVSAAFALDSRTADAVLTVTADAGQVTIVGQVRWPDGMDPVGEIAERVEGVKAVNLKLSYLTLPAAQTVIA